MTGRVTATAWWLGRANMLSGALLLGGCLPGDRLSCNNRDVRASIVEDALTSIRETLKQPLSEETVKTALGDFNLHDTFEVSREGDVISCGGTIGSRPRAKGVPDVPLRYQVTRTNDGSVLYTFDKQSFGPAFVGLIVLEGMAEAAKRGDQNGGGAGAAAPGTQQPAPAIPRQTPYAADPNWSQWRR